MFQSSEHVHQALTDVGYITDTVTATAVYLAASLQKPLLLEGPAGAAKRSSLTRWHARSVPHWSACSATRALPRRRLLASSTRACRGCTSTLLLVAGVSDWASLGKQLSALDFFAAGPLLKALQYPSPCVLLIDELDKVDHSFEAQAFKRACSCFGLGRYFYDFDAPWVDIDDKSRPKKPPTVPAWMVPENWRKGQRPSGRSARVRSRRHRVAELRTALATSSHRNGNGNSAASTSHQ